jgi:hypothetical protein
MATEIFDISNEIKMAVYSNWQEGNIVSTLLDTSSNVTGLWSQFVHTTQTQFIDPSLISRIAEGWQSIKDKIWEKPFNLLSHSSLDLTSFEKCSLLFTEDVIKFCSKHDILPECLKYHKFFIETFKNIQNITITISDDFELADYQKISFVLTISDEIDNILKYEDDFKNRIKHNIDREKRRYFIYNYNLI